MQEKVGEYMQTETELELQSLRHFANLCATWYPVK